MSIFTFPVGYHKYHQDQGLNFQLNRWHSLGYARFEDVKEAGQTIRSFQDWKTEMLRLAERAVSEERLMNAAFDMQVRALTNAKSLTARMFTREEHAHNHCQVGNIGLALDVMLKWLEQW